MHDHERAHEQAPEAAPQRAAAAPSVPAALALQRMIGNRAVGQLVARTPEESVELLEPAIIGAHVDVSRSTARLLPYSKDQESSTRWPRPTRRRPRSPLEKALETHVPSEELDDVRKNVPWRGFPPPKADAAGGGAS